MVSKVNVGADIGINKNIFSIFSVSINSLLRRVNSLMDGLRPAAQRNEAEEPEEDTGEPPARRIRLDVSDSSSNSSQETIPYEASPVAPSAGRVLRSSRAGAATDVDVEVITVDDTTAGIDDSEVVYVQTFTNEGPVTIDLSVSIEDHNYHGSTPMARPAPGPVSRRRRVPRSSRDHSYSDPSPAIEIVESPAAVTTEATSNSQTGLGTCAICLDNYFRRKPMSTTCGHVFCSSCILQAINTTHQCPLCRKKLTLKLIHPIHF